MEVVNTTEEALVLSYLEKMLDHAQNKAALNYRTSNEVIWNDHIEVIQRAIISTRTELLLSKESY